MSADVIVGCDGILTFRRSSTGLQQRRSDGLRRLREDSLQRQGRLLGHRED